MKNSAVFIALLLTVSSCHFDVQRQYDLQFPATLTVSNSGSSVLEIESIYNSNKTDVGFVLNGFSLSPREDKLIRISYEVLSALKERVVEFKGRCRGGESWVLTKEALSIVTSSESDVVFALNQCN